MSVYRRHKKTNYTCIDNQVFKDHDLSMKAKGLLAQIYSLPDNWEYSVRGLATLFSDGRESVNTALQELIEHGYIVRTQKNNVLGQFEGYEYDIYETPQVAENPFTDKPSTENPITDNPTQLNTNLLNNNKENTKRDISPIIPREVSEADKMFAEFWAAYPKKVDKKGCERKFKKIKDLASIFPQIIHALEIQKRSKQWNEENGKYIPYPSTWINQERWNSVNEVEERQARIDQIALDGIEDFFK